MEIAKHAKTESIETVQNELKSGFSSSDAWCSITTRKQPEAAEALFVRAMCSEETARKQAAFEQITKTNPRQGYEARPAGRGRLEYSITQTKNGTRILFVTNFAKQTVKAAITKREFGSDAKIHAEKIRNHFQVQQWDSNSWSYVAAALLYGNNPQGAAE